MTLWIPFLFVLVSAYPPASAETLYRQGNLYGTDYYTDLDGNGYYGSRNLRWNNGVPKWLENETGDLYQCTSLGTCF